MLNPLISIIVPFFNREKTLGRCIESIAAQTYKNLEIILVDDGSSDDSAKVCKALAENDSRITYVYKENGGVSSARNLGLEKAHGEFIGFIDSDDFIESEMYQRLLEPFEKYGDIDITCCGCVGDRIEGFDYKESFLTREKAQILLFDVMNRENYFKGYGVNKLYKAGIIKNNRIAFDTTLAAGEDKLFVFDYLTFCNKVCLIPYFPYHYELIGGATIFTAKSRFSIDNGTTEIVGYCLGKTTDSEVKSYILKWSTIYYKRIILEYYIGNESEASYKYALKEIKKHKAEYLKKGSLLSFKVKLFIITVCHFTSVFRVYKKLRGHI